MVALHILLTGAMAIPYEATKYSIEWYALYKPVNKHLCNKGMFVREEFIQNENPQHIPRVTPDPSQGYGFSEGFQFRTLTLTLGTRTRVPVGLLKPLPITNEG